MPQNTRVYRCVQRLKRKYGYAGAIAICQAATKQSYMTGRSLRKKRKRRKTRKRRRQRRRKKRSQTRHRR